MSGRGVERLITADVIVVGAGNAGLRAAISAAAAGARVLMLSKSPFPGGASAVAGGIRQAAFHPDDSPDLHFTDTIRSGQYLCDQSHVRTLVNEAAARVLDLEALGALFVRSAPGLFRLTLGGGYSAPRGLHARRNDRLMRLVLDRALALGVDFLDQTMVIRLVRDDAGMHGVVALDISRGEIIAASARSVILATGALANVFSRAATPRNSTGEGFALAADVGAPLIDMEFIQFIPLGYVGTFISGMTLGEGSVWGPSVRFLNSSGERYLPRYAPDVTEYRATRDVLARANYLEIMAGRGTPAGAIIVDATAGDPSEFEFGKHAMAHRYRLLRDFYGQEKADLREPLEAAPAALYSCGGVVFDPDCQAEDVPGLFVCGEIAGGVHGANRLNGNSLIDCEVFGKIAGEAAARRAADPSTGLVVTAAEVEARRIDALLQQTGSSRPRALKRRLQRAMWEGVGIVRDANGLRNALAEIADIRSGLSRLVVSTSTRRYNYELVEALELPLMLTVGDMIARSALRREESRGNHYRTDYPAKDDDRWLVHTELRREDGECRLDRRAVDLRYVDPRTAGRTTAMTAVM